MMAGSASIGSVTRKTSAFRRQTFVARQEMFPRSSFMASRSLPERAAGPLQEDVLQRGAPDLALLPGEALLEEALRGLRVLRVHEEPIPDLLHAARERARRRRHLGGVVPRLDDGAPHLPRDDL